MEYGSRKLSPKSSCLIIDTYVCGQCHSYVNGDSDKPQTYDCPKPNWPSQNASNERKMCSEVSSRSQPLSSQVRNLLTKWFSHLSCRLVDPKDWSCHSTASWIYFHQLRGKMTMVSLYRCSIGNTVYTFQVQTHYIPVAVVQYSIVYSYRSLTSDLAEDLPSYKDC